MIQTEEQIRLDEPYTGIVKPWEKWGPYVSDRAWGTVREDYSHDGNAWDYFPFEHAHIRAFRWSEDAIAGLCDRYQVLLFAFAFWNGKDPILKERLFGLKPTQANHGEDVKEYYYYLDCLPSHAYMKFLYKYPQQTFPYQKLIDENTQRNVNDDEYELLDTGIFEEDRYFDIFIEYAKLNSEDTFIRLTVHNRGPEAAPLHILPHLWFRNSWAWSKSHKGKPKINRMDDNDLFCGLGANEDTMSSVKGISLEYTLNNRYLYGPAKGDYLFTNNESNNELLWGTPNVSPFVKDAFHRYLINGENCINPQQEGTKASLHYTLNIPAQSSETLIFRLSPEKVESPFKEADNLFKKRIAEADAFYDTVHPKEATKEERLIQRQAFAGMLWSKQFYNYHVHVWLKGDSAMPTPPKERFKGRNKNWKHVNTKRILSMPDKWEYPWFAAWDLAFHTLSIALVDITFAKEQLWHLLFEQFIQPNGQIPAYEWEFSDLNPPVQAWATMEVYTIEKQKTGKTDRSFLEKCFHKLLLNFAWWVNKVDSQGNNVFEGGFLGLDNITVFDRSVPLNNGAHLEQSDGTGWMGLFCLAMMRIALELSKENSVYESLAVKFFQHYVYIGAAMKKSNNSTYELWSERDGFFYDALCYPDGTYHKFRVRSMVGIIPLFAVEVLDYEMVSQFKEFHSSLDWFLKNRKDLVQECVYTVENEGKRSFVLALMNPQQLKRVVGYLWDAGEFRSTYGLRSLSKFHEKQPYTFEGAHVYYEPGESKGFLKGGNSNWRGPIWFPTTYLAIKSLNKLYSAYGEQFVLDALDENNKQVTLKKIASTFAKGLTNLFKEDAAGGRPCFGDHAKFKTPYWKDNILFYEHFHGDTGRGLGASHQTGWTGLITNIIDEWGSSI